ncbi:MAG: hypothetical protein J5606_02920 [Bacteroidales bacterium]|nr:hypothetical protein [Bacteroidales bacterium]
MIILLSMFCFPIFSQEIDIGEPETQTLKIRQWDMFLSLHTNGVGVGARIEKIKSVKLQHGFDMEWTFYRHFKEQRLNNFVLGKKNYFFLLRGGYGCTRILNTRPYNGGVEFGYFFYGGLSLGVSIPVFVNVYYIYYNSDGQAVLDIKTEQYTEDTYIDMIESKAPFLSGIKKIKFHPGIYAKTGFSFDFSSNDNFVLKMDMGVAVDVYALPVEKMMFAPKQYLLLTGFLTLHLGKRKSIHDL